MLDLNNRLAKIISGLDNDEEINIEFSRNDGNKGFIMGITARSFFDNDIILVAEHGSQYTLCFNDNCFSNSFDDYLEMAQKIISEYDVQDFK